MPASIHETLTYPATTVAEVSAMLADPGFREAVATYQHALRSSATMTPHGDGHRAVVEIVHGTEHVPSFARKLVGEEIRIVQQEDWTGADHADVRVEIPGKPGDMSGTLDLAQVGDDVVETVRLVVKVSLPLIGGKIEGLIADLLKQAFRAENKVGTKWLVGEWEQR